MIRSLVEKRRRQGGSRWFESSRIAFTIWSGGLQRENLVHQVYRQADALIKADSYAQFEALKVRFLP